MKSPVSIKGGESVYCINESQLQESLRLVNDDPHSAPRLQKTLKELDAAFTRNERAALAFAIIERLRTSKV